jgi:hypothetical protein
MQKKNKFAGKKTKLAEHALTQVLEQERAEASEASESWEAPSSSLTLLQAVQAFRNDQLNLDLPQADGHPIPTQRQMETANTYLILLQELENMRELLRAPNLPERTRAVGQRSWSLPNSEIIAYSLQVIGHTLQEIKTLMG